MEMGAPTKRAREELDAQCELILKKQEIARLRGELQTLRETHVKTELELVSANGERDRMQDVLLRTQAEVTQWKKKYSAASSQLAEYEQVNAENRHLEEALECNRKEMDAFRSAVGVHGCVCVLSMC
jgi:hypothetical protein